MRASPEPVFAVSAKVWVGSTTRSIAGLPDVSGAVRTSPPNGPTWTTADIAPRVHFVNCHGAEFDPKWYGQLSPNNWNLPVAIAASNIPAAVPRGQVVATECCYGTAHWPPSAAGGQAGVALTYLLAGASGVFGSSTVAYGPATTNDYADVICRLFVEQVLGGASTGRAALVARQRFIQSQAFLDPTDVKTLAQFALLGDPSAVPFVAATGGAAAPKGMIRRTAVTPPFASASLMARRETMAAIGTALDRTTVSCAPTARSRSQMTNRALGALLGRTIPTEYDDPHLRHPAGRRTASAGERAPGPGRLPARDDRSSRLARRRPPGAVGRVRGPRSVAAVSESRQTGRVAVHRVGAGSKSEQISVVLTTAERTWLLRRAGGSTFGPDRELARLAGRTVTVTGYEGNGTFLVTADPEPQD